MNIIDTHCHLNFKSFKSDYLKVAKKSFENGVIGVIIVGSDSKTSTQALEVAKEINMHLKQCWAYFSAGIHPIHFKDAENFSVIEELSSHELAVAIGETGFDFHHLEKTCFDQQWDLLKLHSNLAKKVDLPLILHSRNADEEFLEILDKIDSRGVFHCFSSDYKFADKLIKSGFFISFTGSITYGNKKLKKVIKKLPSDRIMIETDAPYIVPEPLRSEGVKRSEPYMAIETAKKIAIERGVDLSEILSQTTENAIRFFDLT